MKVSMQRLPLLQQRCGAAARHSLAQLRSTSRWQPAVTASCTPAATTTHRSFASPSTTGTQPSSNLKRSSKYATLTDQHIQKFQQIVGDNNALHGKPEDLEGYNKDWMNKFHGKATLVLRPGSTQEVADIIQYCNSEKLAIVPQGGNSGLVGGSVPVFDEIILSLQRLNKIHTIDSLLGIITLDSGVVLETANSELEKNGLIFPLDLGAKGSCHVGGNVSTNAGGLRYVRYGSLHGNVLGMEVVTGSGEILDLTSTLRKDNTGYDLKQLFIGGEGTLGIITKLNVLCPRKPAAVNVAYLGVDSYDSVLETLKRARNELSDILSAVEFQDRHSLEVCVKHASAQGAKDPLDEPHPFYMLLETHGSNTEHDSEKLQNFLEKAMEDGCIADGVVAESFDQQRQLWTLRESITEGIGKEGYVYKYDISLPVAEMYPMVEHMNEQLEKYDAKVVGYGHLGDGNLHLNAYTKKYDERVFNGIEPYLFERVSKLKGSISAEHGLGRTKNVYLHYSKSQSAIDWMYKMKKMFDPNHVLQPYKYLPPAEGSQ